MALSAQERVLDSLMNRPVSGTPLLILIKNGRVATDTAVADKVRYVKKDSTVAVKYMNKRATHVKAAEFWGISTSFGEKRRFYKGRAYVLWHTKPPYIYRLYFDRADCYFSDSLSGPLYHLDKETVAHSTESAATKKYLQDFITENATQAKGYQRNYKRIIKDVDIYDSIEEAAYNTMVVIADMALFLLESFFCHR